VTRLRRTLALVVLAAAVVAGALPATAAGARPATTRTPIAHLVVLMQENRSFDHYFGTFPGVDGIPPGSCVPTARRAPRPCVAPFHLGPQAGLGLGHDQRVLQAQFAARARGGFIPPVRGAGGDGRLAVGYYDGRDIPYYWAVARQGVLFDHFFTASARGGMSNRMYWLTATPGEASNAIPPGGFGALPTIFDRLEARGVSWRMYVQDYDPRITFRTRGEFADRGLQVTRAPLLAFPRYIDDPRLAGHIVDLGRYFTDLERGTLPAVSYIVPWGASEHPPGSPQAGERFVRSLVTGLVRSTAWPSSAFLWTYDDWGGWYDHVQPPRRDAWGDGFRVPALLVSPYARPGFVDRTPLDITSVLRFIERNWRLRPLSTRDARAADIGGAFAFGRPPRPPALLAAGPPGEGPPPSHGTLVYAGYGAALALALAIVLLAAGGPRRRGRRGRPA
jgi:phospholipase C